jgi:hypothetical protein
MEPAAGHGNTMFICLCRWALHSVRILLIGVLFISGANLAAAQGRRVALVVGNGAYRNVPQLTNPANDARLMARTLQDLGFQLIGGGAKVDLDKTDLDAAVRAFGQQLVGAEVALFYYSGHGLQVQGSNWLVPLDANPTRVQDLDFQMVDASLVLRQMEGGGTKLNLMILDACRNNPFGGRGLRGVETGLAQMRAPEGTLISYATQPGNTASDGTGVNSPYTQALSEAMRQPGLDVLRMFNRVGVAVKKTTGGVQQPWVSASPLDSDYFIAGPETNPIAATPAVTPVAPPVASPAARQPTQRMPAVMADSVTNLAGNWRYADGADCTPVHEGIINVANGHIYFEWRRGFGPANLAIERIDRVDGNAIYTTVESDENTGSPEIGHKIRYMVDGDAWTSLNLTTGRRYTHHRC